jgi:tRNA-Thr(GGU) m(6)t(6)A37 methyltransferase TsaA
LTLANLQCIPIGTFSCIAKERYEVAWQSGLLQDVRGVVELNKGFNFEQALLDLNGFTHIWLLFWIHRNAHWKPMVQPPRGTKKRGLFSTRSPHRPNPIGLSCVELLKVEGLSLHVGSHDLLDGTPILDIKPYIPAWDSFPEAKAGWFDELGKVTPFLVTWSSKAKAQAAFISDNGGPDLIAMTNSRLSLTPTPHPGKRIAELGGGVFELAYKTWRLHFEVKGEEVFVQLVRSGYSEVELNRREDRWKDKDLHRRFGWNF